MHGLSNFSLKTSFLAVLLACTWTSTEAWYRALQEDSSGSSTSDSSYTSDNCCAVCLKESANTGTDAVNFTACELEQTACCFDDVCYPSDFGEPSYSTTDLGYVNNTPTVNAGHYIKFTWSGADYVNYITIVEGQSKTSQVKNSSSSATTKGDYFYICSESEGTVYLRAFDDSGCHASYEYSVDVVSGSQYGDTLTCSEDDTTPDDSTVSSSSGNSDSSSTSTSSGSTSTTSCNTQRGSVVDGVCTCQTEWTNPPNCDKWVWWKYLYVVAAACAAFFSIVLSLLGFRKYWKNRQNKLEQEGGGAKQSDVEILNTSSENTYYNRQSPNTTTANGNTRATKTNNIERPAGNNSEFTL